MKYIDEFLSLRSACDILRVVTPLNEPTKKITESMAIIQKLRKIALNNPNCQEKTVFNADTDIVRAIQADKIKKEIGF